MVVLSGVTAAALTAAPWPVNWRSGVPAGNAQVRTILSAPAVTIRFPSGPSATPRTRSGCGIVFGALIGYTHERSTPSAPTVTKPLPFPLTAMPVTAPVLAISVPAGFPSAVQRMAFPSAVPAATAAPFGHCATDVIADVAPAKSRTSWPFVTLESLTALSAPPVKVPLPSAETAMHEIASACAGNGFAAGTGNCHDFHRPSSLTV